MDQPLKYAAQWKEPGAQCPAKVNPWRLEADWWLPGPGRRGGDGQLLLPGHRVSFWGDDLFWNETEGVVAQCREYTKCH